MPRLSKLKSLTTLLCISVQTSIMARVFSYYIYRANSRLKRGVEVTALRFKKVPYKGFDICTHGYRHMILIVIVI